MVRTSLTTLVVMGLMGFSAQAGAQSLEDRLAQAQQACPEAEIRTVSSSMAGPYRNLLGGQRYLHNPCDLETNENPILLRATYDFENIHTYGTSTSSDRVAASAIGYIPYDERYGPFVELAIRMGRPNLIPTGESRTYQNSVRF